MFVGSNATLCRLFVTLIICFNNQHTIAAEDPAPTGIFNNKACVECHEKDNAELIKDWRLSLHANKLPDTTQYTADCISCHGVSHEDSLVPARHDSACIECHGGKKTPVVHSYSTSKHGTLMRLEQKQQNWNMPLESANYRTPGCAYCHMYAGEHNVSSTVRDWTVLTDTDVINLEQTQNKIQRVCQDCHSPKYVRQLLNNAEAMLQIARKKIREANVLIEEASLAFTENELSAARQQMKKMQQHLKNVYLGTGHQSPDYQWWYGQPAMDGDLLRIKGILDQLYRQQQIKLNN